MEEHYNGKVEAIKPIDYDNTIDTIDNLENEIAEKESELKLHRERLLEIIEALKE